MESSVLVHYEITMTVLRSRSLVLDSLSARCRLEHIFIHHDRPCCPLPLLDRLCSSRSQMTRESRCFVEHREHVRRRFHAGLFDLFIFDFSCPLPQKIKHSTRALTLPCRALQQSVNGDLFVLCPLRLRSCSPTASCPIRRSGTHRPPRTRKKEETVDQLRM